MDEESVIDQPDNEARIAALENQVAELQHEMLIVAKGSIEMLTRHLKQEHPCH